MKGKEINAKEISDSEINEDTLQVPNLCSNCVHRDFDLA